MKKTLYLFALAALTLPTANVQAQDSTAAPKADDGKLTISGYIDSYYQTAFNQGSPYGRVGGRIFDGLTNQFALGLVQTKFAYSNSKSDMVVDLTFGPNAELGNFGNVAYGAGGGYGGYAPTQNSLLYGTSAAIKQAYFTYKFTDKWNFTVGQFGTHIGYEVIDAPVNYNYSLSNLFGNGPFYHIGAKTSYAFSDKFAVMTGVVNNWDALTDWKTQKSVVGQIFVSPIEGWNLYFNYIGGYHDDYQKIAPTAPGATDASTAAPNSTPYVRNLFDLTTGYQITDKLYAGINAAFGWYDYQDGELKLSNKGVGKMVGDSANKIGWGGIALYANYKINDMFGIGARYEHFDDRNGVRYFKGINNSLTLTVPITLADGHIIIKPEFRWDTGNAATAPSKDADGKTYTVGGGYYTATDVWAQKNTPAPVTGKHLAQTAGQSTIGLAFIYKY